MSNDGDFTLPPKKRNWKPGNWQIGFFVRTPEGDTMTLINDDAPEDWAKKIKALALKKKAKR